MMRYLLDTCALIWLGMGGGELSADDFRRMRHEAFVAETLKSEAEYKAGNYKIGSAEELMAEVMNGLDDED